LRANGFFFPFKKRPFSRLGSALRSWQNRLCKVDWIFGSRKAQWCELGILSYLGSSGCFLNRKATQGLGNIHHYQEKRKENLNKVA
jgi:hypothetical protein